VDSPVQLTLCNVRPRLAIVTQWTGVNCDSICYLCYQVPLIAVCRGSVRTG